MNLLAPIAAIVYGALFTGALFAGAIAWHNQGAMALGFSAAAFAFIEFVLIDVASRPLLIALVLASWLLDAAGALLLVW